MLGSKLSVLVLGATSGTSCRSLLASPLPEGGKDLYWVVSLNGEDSLTGVIDLDTRKAIGMNDRPEQDMLE